MDSQKLKNISAALYSYSAADFNADFTQQISIQDLIDVVRINEDERASFRAAWALEHLLLKDVESLRKYTENILQIYFTSTNWSVLRSISKLIMLLLKNPLKYILYIDEKLQGLLLDKTFNLLATNDCPIALRCNAYDIIFLTGKDENWVLSELKTQIYFDLEKNTTPALRSRGEKIIKSINKFFL